MKPVATIDYVLCDPTICENGVCRVVAACPRKLIKQEEPYEMPNAYPNMCRGCAVCIQACPKGAVRMV